MFSEESVGLCEEMGLQPISELFATNGGWAQVCSSSVIWFLHKNHLTDETEMVPWDVGRG